MVVDIFHESEFSAGLQKIPWTRTLSQLPDKPPMVKLQRHGNYAPYLLIPIDEAEDVAKSLLFLLEFHRKMESDIVPSLVSENIGRPDAPVEMSEEKGEVPVVMEVQITEAEPVAEVSENAPVEMLEKGALRVEADTSGLIDEKNPPPPEGSPHPDAGLPIDQLWHPCNNCTRYERGCTQKQQRAMVNLMSCVDQYPRRSRDNQARLEKEGRC